MQRARGTIWTHGLAILTFCLVLTLTLVFQLSRVNELTLHNAGFFAHGLDQLDSASILSASASRWLQTSDSPSAWELWLAEHLASLIDDALDERYVNELRQTASHELALYFSGEHDELVLRLDLTSFKSNLGLMINQRFEAEWAAWFSSLLLPAIPEQVCTGDLGHNFLWLRQVRHVSILLNHQALGWALRFVLLLLAMCVVVHRTEALGYITLAIALAGWALLLALPYINATFHMQLATTQLHPGVWWRPLVFSTKDALMATTRQVAWHTALAGTLALGIVSVVNSLGRKG